MTNTARKTKSSMIEHEGRGAPLHYDLLHDFLPDRRQRQLVLGVTENTLIAWDKRKASRIRVEHQKKVNLVVSTCRSLATLFARPAEVGRFLVTPQLILGNREPFGLMRLYGERGARILYAVVEDEHRRADEIRERLELEPVLGDTEAWDAIRAGLSDRALERLAISTASTKKLREEHGSTDVLY